MPEWAVKRWTRQMNSSYEDLPDDERKSDKQEAFKAIDVIVDYIVE